EDAPEDRLAQTHPVLLAVEHPQVEGQQAEDEGDEGAPLQRGAERFHGVRSLSEACRCRTAGGRGGARTERNCPSPQGELVSTAPSPALPPVRRRGVRRRERPPALAARAGA